MRETYVVGFDTYPEARDAVSAAIAAGYREDHLNVLVQDRVVKGAADIDWETVRAEKSSEGAQRTVRGLDAAVAGKDTVVTQDAGELIASGEIARIIANTAASSARGPATLADALTESGLAPDVAQRDCDRLVRGGVILILPVEEERERMALPALDPHHPKDMTRTQS